ncbi:unknown [Orgyia pseudotsugata multiple nucleopolyhedrovirus]|uniref:Uncharacterized protein n=1 Tax=Orgyia pseudotsugata multicapsid polyhedrosis virus TaxID=262177 RepID=O10291_NPVOP|nr:hypothetical protein OpmnVgp036 [Orgyia pseudotsugata multiple nucleopolyhedrovirus]AAC59035.1 unknown [Orgyia pseudotsugata multiple nucleopolyhedrovirus]
MITLIARDAREPELQILIIGMLASLPTLTLLLCSPQMIVRDCAGAGGAWVNGTLQSTAAAHAAMHNACVAFATGAFSLGLLLDTLTRGPPRQPKATALFAFLFCNKLALVAAVIRTCAGSTVNAGQLLAGRLHVAEMDDSLLLCALYAVTVLSIIHVAQWLFFDWKTLFESRDLAPFAATAVVATTLYVVALTLARSTVPANGLQMFRNASVAACRLNDGGWFTMALP